MTFGLFHTACLTAMRPALFSTGRLHGARAWFLLYCFRIGSSRANCKLPASPAHRLCAEIRARALRILSDCVAIAKNQKFPNFFDRRTYGSSVGLANDQLAGRLGFEPRQTASKAVDLPLVDRPVRSPVFPPGEHHSANIVRQYSPRGKVSVRIALQPVA